MKPDIKNILLEAKNLILENNLKQALKLLNSILIYKRDNIFYEEIVFEIGKIYMIIGKYSDSLKMLKKIKSIHFLVYSEDMIFKIYKIIGDNENLFKIYNKIKKNNRHTIEQTKSVIEIALNLKEYKKILNFIKIYEYTFGIDEYLSNKKKEFYKNICIYIQDLNINNKYIETKKFFKKIYSSIPKSELKIRNILLNEYEIASGKVKLKSFPRQLSVRLTNKCNLNCIMCNPKKNSNKNNKLYELSNKNYEELLQIIPYLDRLILQGGEVLLYKKIYEILEVAHKHDVYIEIVTNGLLLDKKMIEILIKMKSELTISIDGFNEYVYEKIRIGGKYKTLISKLELLKKIKLEKDNELKLRLQMVVMKSNYMQIENALNFAKKYLFNEVSLLPIRSGKTIDNSECIFDISYNSNILKYLIDNRDKFNLIAKKLKIKLINNLPNVKDLKNINENKLEYIPILKDNIFLEQLNDNNIKDNNNIFCFLPWKNAYYNGFFILPTCICPTYKHYFFKSNKFKSMIKSWNKGIILYYRKLILLNRQNLICNKFCLNSNILKYERKMIIY